MVVHISAIVFSILIGVIIVFQFALASGVPWGEYAMGGKFPGKYPPWMRIAALIQIVILALMALVVLAKAGLALPEWRSFSKTAVWFVVGFSVIAAILNIMTKSTGERRIWAPVSIMLLFTSIIVALG
jgi:hypothetical protein